VSNSVKGEKRISNGKKNTRCPEEPGSQEEETEEGEGKVLRRASI